MPKIYQNFLALVIIIAVISLGVYFNPEGPQNIQGIYLPQTDQIFTPTSADKITLMTSSTLPDHAQIIGLINTSTHFKQLSSQQEQSLFQASLEKAKELAAAEGGNTLGLVLANAGGTPGSPLDTFNTQFAVIKN